MLACCLDYVWKSKDKYCTFKTFKGLLQYFWHYPIAQHLICLSAPGREPEPGPPWFWSESYRIPGRCQAAVYRREAANFHQAQDGNGQPPWAACEQEWTHAHWVILRDTKTIKPLGVCAPHFLCVTEMKQTGQNATFTFATQKYRELPHRLHPLINLGETSYSRHSRHYLLQALQIFTNKNYGQTSKHIYILV